MIDVIYLLFFVDLTKKYKLTIQNFYKMLVLIIITKTISKTNTCLAKGIMIKLTLINLRHFC